MCTGTRCASSREGCSCSSPRAISPAAGESILEEAHRLVYGDRHDDYGHPADDYEKVAAIWAVILEQPVTAKQAALCMVGVKLARELHRPKRDNLVDLAGYAAVAARIEGRLAGTE